MIIDSIRLLMGARAQKEQIRRGENSATVVGLFRDLSQDAVRALAEIGIEPDENGGSGYSAHRILGRQRKNACRRASDNASASA